MIETNDCEAELHMQEEIERLQEEVAALRAHRDSLKASVDKLQNMIIASWREEQR